MSVGLRRNLMITLAQGETIFCHAREKSVRSVYSFSRSYFSSTPSASKAAFVSNDAFMNSSPVFYSRMLPSNSSVRYYSTHTSGDKLPHTTGVGGKQQSPDLIAGRDIRNTSFVYKNYYHFGGGAVALAVLMGVGGYVYCDKNPEVELCESVRAKMGIKRKVNNVSPPFLQSVLRKEALKQIHTLFSNNNQIVAIVGKKGSGKTELTRQYVAQYKSFYYHFWHIEGEKWEEGLRALALELGIYSVKQLKQTDIQSVWTSIVSILEKGGLYPRKSLLIIDNVAPDFFIKNLKNLIPHKTDILVTSRGANWEAKVGLDAEFQLTRQEALNILKTFIPQEKYEEKEAEQIFKLIGSAPPALVLSALIIERGSFSIQDFLVQFKESKEKISKRWKNSDNLLGRSQDIVALLSMVKLLRIHEKIDVSLMQYCKTHIEDSELHLFLQLLVDNPNVEEVVDIGGKMVNMVADRLKDLFRN